MVSSLGFKTCCDVLCFVPENTGHIPARRVRRPAAHDLLCQQIDLKISKSKERVCSACHWRSTRLGKRRGKKQYLGKPPLTRQIGRAVITMAMTRVGTRTSGMLEGPVLNA
ncbi:hypothetical protein ACS7SF_15085 [Ralstonia sp. 25C]|uniref:hypothetical protein n=1 Tax=Ralstonia sp. 25C TaxID=3447363 RepID=UPI003F74CB6D